MYLHANYSDLSPVEQPTPITPRVSCMGRAVGGPTLTLRPVERTSPRWSPRPVVAFPLTAWLALPWTWAAATSFPVAAPTCFMAATWREAATTYHTHRAPPQLW